MPIYATNNGNIGDYNTVSGVVSQVSGSHVGLSGDYASTSGNIADYPAVSGDYAATSGTISDYIVLSGDWVGLTGDYVLTSGDYSASSGDLSDYKVVSGVAAAGGGGGHNEITGLSGGAWSVFYSEADAIITGLALGASGLVLSSVGQTSAPVWSPKSAGGGDDLGSHEAIKMLDMNTYKITGMGDPGADQDAATKIFVDNHNWTKGDITDLDTSGYENASGDIALVSGDYAATSGTVSDYAVFSGAYSSHQGSAIAHHRATVINDTPTDAETTTGASSNWAYDHDALYTTLSGMAEAVSGNYAASSGDLADYKTVSGDYVTTSGNYASHLHDGQTLQNIASVNETGFSITAWTGDISILAWTGIINVSGSRITGLDNPINARDAVNLQYHEILSGAIDDYATVSGDYAASSGDLSDYKVVSGAYVSTAGDYITTSGNYASSSGDLSDYKVVSGNYAASSGDLGDYKVVSGAYVSTAADYITTSGDYSASSGDVSDYKVVSGVVAAGGGGITGISELDAQAWTMFYNDAGAISGFILGASGLQLSSMGASAIPVWSAPGAGAGDNLGSHEAGKMLDMNTFKITGLGDPADDQDGATKIFVDNHNWTKGDITDLDTSGYEQASGDVALISGDYAATSGTVSDYAVFSGDYSASSGDVSDYKVVSGVVAAGGGDGTTHITGLTGGLWSVFYSEEFSGLVTGLALGSDDTFLKSNGATSAPTFESYTEGAALTDLSNVVTASEAEGDILLRGGSNWANLAKGTSGYALKVGASTALWEQIVEADIGDLGSYLENVNEDASPELGGDLDLAGYNISLAPSFGSDHQHEGLVVSKTTDAGAYGQALYMKSNGAYGLAQADAAGTIPCSAIWIASGKVLLIGTIRDDSYDFTVGGYVYVSESVAGGFTTTAPSTSTNIVQKVGIADSADSMYFNPGGFRTVTVA